MSDAPIYQEALRPQFHFTAQRNWLNDPNGLIYYQGEYHLFFQHNPKGINWGNMTWGHAISRDLVHWEQLPNAIEPDELGTIFSGSGVVDWHNTTGFQTGDEAVLVNMYTSAGDPFTQSIAYSNDRGRTWHKYEGNPVLAHIRANNRDPKVIWHSPTQRWVMALYLDHNDYALFTSPNLIEWAKLCDVTLSGASECPDFFELPVDGDPSRTEWVFRGANGTYLIGCFDGESFEPESDPLPSEWGANSYASQTWSDVPASDGRRIQICWMRGGKYPEMPFNQQMSFPCVLTLRTTPVGIRLFREPVEEIQAIYEMEQAHESLTLGPCNFPLGYPDGELFDIEVHARPGDGCVLELEARGEVIRYVTDEGTLTSLGRSAPLPRGEDGVHLRVLVDQTSIEVFAGHGAVSLASCFIPDESKAGAQLRVAEGQAKIASAQFRRLRSTWIS